MLFRISALVGVVFADILAGYALWMMMIYLTDVWQLKLTYAAGIVNVFLGLIGVLPLALQFLVDTFVGNFWMLIVSSLSYCVGMGILTLSTPPVLANTLDTCSAYEPECIGNIHRMLFCAAIVLMAVGISGHTVCLASFMVEQPLTVSVIEFHGRSLLTMLGGSWMILLFTTITAFGLAYIKPWSFRFGIPAIFMVVATVFLLTMSGYYSKNRPEGNSPLLILLRVLAASASKFLIKRPPDLTHYNGVPEYAALVHQIPPLRCSRCLEKAAIILPHQTLEQQRWRLCTLTEVRNAQHLIFMIPMAMSFILWGLVSSLPYTYFAEQAKNMNHKVGSLTLPITFLLWLYVLARRHLPKLACRMCSAPVYGVVMSMIFAIICCVTAGSVESRRLDVVKKNGLLSNPIEEVPMSVVWLVPQFVILGAVDGFMETGTALVLQDRFVFSWWRFMLTFTSFANGLGCFGSLVAVYAVGKINESGGKASWFQDTLNESRLDKYYLTLAWLIACNLGVYTGLIYWYRYMMYKEEFEPGERQPFCCCCC